MITLPQHFSLAQIESMKNPHIETGDVVSNRLQLSFIDQDVKGFHTHTSQSESTLCLTGGAVIETLQRLIVIDDKRKFYCRIPAGMSHCRRINGIAQSVHTGPQIREQTIDDIAPPNVGAISPPDIHMIRATEEAFYTTDRIVTVGKREIDILKAELPNTARKRIRLCCHPVTSDPLHEMFVLYTKSTYIQPNKHLAKEETFLILEGDADFIFYSDSGDVTQIIPLGSPSSGKDFFVRVPAGVYHSVAMNSDYLVIHEATPGPYVREHTVWAPWAKSQGSRT